MDTKVIGLGFQKTGTSSLREALKILGYKVKDTSQRALIPILKGNDKKIKRILKNYNALEDTPWYMIYEKLDVWYPNSKFILTIRDEEDWYKSVSRHIGDLKNPMHEWIYGLGKGLPKDNKKNTIEVYKNHNKNVIEYFKDRPIDLLIIDFSKNQGWDEICKFLNKSIPDATFPHANKTIKRNRNLIQKSLRKFKLYRKKTKYIIKIAYINKFIGWNKK
ncbi:MAG: hypothetical protein CL846_06555 [Crocinitomicaceae bacterium]|nr:hypothetical protein [Crocinitomicaceae bacterium]|tara:strand:- start:1748 stop:2404 length:657 start_codon:yes stop_codon:yes gene_type:complete